MADIAPVITPEKEEIDSLIREVSKFVFEDSDYENQDKFLKFVNQEPPKAWIRTRQSVKYMPIGILEALMQKIFKRVRVEVKSYSLLANTVTVHVRVHYWHPVYKEWEWQDGVGGVPIQIKNPDKKEVSAIDFAQMQSLAVQMGLPGAESFATKDAIEKIGKLFGRDISRVDVMDYKDAFIAPVNLEKEGFSPSKK